MGVTSPRSAWALRNKINSERIAPMVPSAYSAADAASLPSMTRSSHRGYGFRWGGNYQWRLGRLEVQMHVIAGVDLAWMGSRNPTAIATGRVEHRAVVVTSVVERLYGTQSVIDALDDVVDLHGIAIDGPLIIKNQTGQRICERELGMTYGGRKASCHTSNLDRFPDAAGTQLSSHLSRAGFQHLSSPEGRWQLECYPHPALIEIFGLRERLAYKKGTVLQKRSGQIRLANLICSLGESEVMCLRVPDSFQYFMDEQRISLLRGDQLKHNEDVLDAIVCMYIGALYQSGQDHTVFGTTMNGYIYVPTKQCLPEAGGLG